MSTFIKPCSDDVILWPCGAWCLREELPEYTHKSDDYEVIYYGTVKHAKFIAEEGEITTNSTAESIRHELEQHHGWKFV